MNAQLAVLPFADTWGMHDVGAGWGIAMIAFWAVAIWGVVWLARGGSSRLYTTRSEGAIDILDRRLAEGSISSEEYEETRRTLTNRGPEGPPAPPKRTETAGHVSH